MICEALGDLKEIPSLDPSPPLSDPLTIRAAGLRSVSPETPATSTTFCDGMSQDSSTTTSLGPRPSPRLSLLDAQASVQHFTALCTLSPLYQVPTCARCETPNAAVHKSVPRSYRSTQVRRQQERSPCKGGAAHLYN